MQTHKQIYLRSLKLTLICQSSKGDEWEGVCSAQEDVRMSKYLRKTSRSPPTSIYMSPKRIEPLAHETATFRVIKRAGPAWTDAHGIRSLHCNLPDKRHMSCFEFRSFDHNGHLKVLVHALEWPDAPVTKTGRAGHAQPARVKPRPDALLELTRWVTPSVRLESSKHPRTTECVRSIVTERATASDRPHVFHSFSRAWPDALVQNPSDPHLTTTATDRTRLVIQRPCLVQRSVTPVTFVRLHFYPR
jgi:hypothetical protein